MMLKEQQELWRDSEGPSEWSCLSIAQGNGSQWRRGQMMTRSGLHFKVFPAVLTLEHYSKWNVTMFKEQYHVHSFIIY